MCIKHNNVTIDWCRVIRSGHNGYFKTKLSHKSSFDRCTTSLQRPARYKSAILPMCSLCDSRVGPRNPDKYISKLCFILISNTLTEQRTSTTIWTKYYLCSASSCLNGFPPICYSGILWLHQNHIITTVRFLLFLILVTLYTLWLNSFCLRCSVRLIIWYT